MIRLIKSLTLTEELKVVIEGQPVNGKSAKKKKLPKFVRAVLLTIIGALAAAIFGAILTFGNPLKDFYEAAVQTHNERDIDSDVETVP